MDHRLGTLNNGCGVRKETKRKSTEDAAAASAHKETEEASSVEPPAVAAESASSDRIHIKHMGMAWIHVSDLAKSKQFFTETLGLRLVGGSEEYNWLEIRGSEDNGAILGVGKPDDSTPESNPIKPGNNAVVTFTVDDIVATKALLEKKQVTIIGDILEVPGHVKLLFISDADGNTFQIVQELDAKPHQ